MIEKKLNSVSPFRRWTLISLFILAAVLLLWRDFDIQILNKDFLRGHGDARSLRVVDVPAHRGVITDRNGEPLAISTPVKSVWATPQKVLLQKSGLADIARILETDNEKLQQLLQERSGREFVYLKRHITPDQAKAINTLSIDGVHLQREYKRYYPAGEVTAHLIGFTNVDDHGQEGIELAYDEWLQGKSGSKRVLKDRLGRTVQDVESITTPKPGKPLTLSIDRRVQYLAYRELKSAVTLHRVRSGTLVMLNAHTGEIMAMAVQPSYNPNNRSGLKSSHYRNRAVIDVFEPGSTLKPFTIAAALISGLYTPDSIIDTRPGYYNIGNNTVRDERNYGVIDIQNVIKKSSNVGASKIALSLGPHRIWEVHTNVGFGQQTGSGYPGEAAGLLNNYNNWSEFELATISFGYGIAVTTLQLAQAYAVIAADGMLRPVTFQKVTDPVDGRQVIPAKVAREVRTMLETVVAPGGTGQRASVKGYRIAGKTGTAHKAIDGSYAEHRYLSLFAGMAPASNPQLVLVVVIDEPQGDQYYGGEVAAPVFAKVMDGSLRILNITPDDLPSFGTQVVVAGNTNTDFQGMK